MRHHIAAPSSTPTTPNTPYLRPSSKPRGSYNCGRCGLSKKRHICDSSTTTISTNAVTATPRPPPIRTQRALFFHDFDIGESYDTEIDAQPGPRPEPEPEPDCFDPDRMVSGGLTAGCVWEVLKRLPPSSLMSASGVCRGWRDVSLWVWKSCIELRVRVPIFGSVGFVGLVLKKCSSSLVRISLTIQSDVDETMLACIAFSCPNLESMEILTSE